METIRDQLQQIFREVFENDKILISRETIAGDITHWDSLRHVILIVKIEEGFAIKFTLDEVISMKNVGVLLDLIQKKSNR